MFCLRKPAVVEIHDTVPHPVTRLLEVRTFLVSRRLAIARLFCAEDWADQWDTPTPVIKQVSNNRDMRG